MKENRKHRDYEEYVKQYKLYTFDKITNHEQSYLIGYLLGDGGLNKEVPGKRKARLFISSIDKYIIEHFRDEFQPDNSIDSRIPINKKRNIKTTKKSYRMTFSSKFEKTFNKFGILDLKINRTYHNIKKDFMSSFLLGLFDADGCMSWDRRKDRNRLWSNFMITHQSLKMLNKLQKFFLEELHIPTSILPKGDEKCYVFRTSNRKDVIKIIDYMYSQKPKVYNYRKYNNCLKFKQEFLNKNK